MLEKHSDSEVHVEKIEQRPTASIAFGLERLGLIAVQAPILSCIVLVVLIIGAIFGIDRIKIDDSLSQLFRSNSKEYRQYEAVTKRFPATEFDVLVVVEDLADSGLKAELSGVPVMQLEIRNAVERDGLTYNILGILAGCIIAIIFFRKISFMVVAAFPPMIAILLALGGLGWANFNLNMFLNVMTPLIMVISFSDSMQLTFAARDRLIAGQDKYTAFRNAVLVVGPACVLTHGTAGISFIALQFSDSDLIRKFGEAGLAATIIALIAVLSLVPVFGVLFVRNEKVFAVKFQGADAGVQMLRNFCYWIAVRMVSRPGLFSLLAVIFVGGLAVVYANLEPRYRLGDQVPDKQQAVAASGRLDAKLTGANPIDVLIEFPL